MFLEHLWVDFIEWWRPAHALLRCSEFSATSKIARRQPGAGTTRVGRAMRGSVGGANDAVGQWTWRERAQVTAVGMAVSVAAASQG